MFIYAGPFESCPSSVISAASSRKLSAGTGVSGFDSACPIFFWFC